MRGEEGGLYTEAVNELLLSPSLTMGGGNGLHMGGGGGGVDYENQ